MTFPVTFQGAAPARLDVAFPFAVDGRGRTAADGYDDHVHDMIELLLFTRPGERVMRPDFGCGLADLVFAPNSPELAATVQISIQAALQRWLGDVIDIVGLEVRSEDSVLTISVAYLVRATGSQRSDVFTERATQ
jgi:phage baseplate assembly protein W